MMTVLFFVATLAVPLSPYPVAAMQQQNAFRAEVLRDEAQLRQQQIIQEQATRETQQRLNRLHPRVYVHHPTAESAAPKQPFYQPRPVFTWPKPYRPGDPPTLFDGP